VAGKSGKTQQIWGFPKEMGKTISVFLIFFLCLVGAGHYLFIEFSNRALNGTARLFSPVYGPPKASAAVNEEVCFSFWFHMYGSTAGKMLHPDIIL
jgi:hypothetical protein